MFIPLKDENPTSRFPVITVALIALNVLIFFYHILSPEGLQFFIYKFGAIPYEITHFKPISFALEATREPIGRISPFLALFTSMFLHGSLLHLLGNMLYLWIFGNNIEDYLGPVRFILFYLIAGLGASLTHILLNANSQIPMIGASGAIAGILGAYLILYPRARVLTLVFLFIFIQVLPIPAVIILGIWFFAQIMNLGIGGGVAWLAHIGGFLIGLGIARYYQIKRRRTWADI
jgi:membrane associated rhomboid family serine protease